MKKNNILGAFQIFGGAMGVPVAFLPFTGLVLGITGILTMPQIMGELASPEHWFYRVMTIIKSGAWTIFKNFPLLFCMALPVSLAKTAQARAVLVAFFSFMAFNYFINGILTFWGKDFGFNDFTNMALTDRELTSRGLAVFGGIRTLDTSIVFSLIISGLVTWIHNRFFEKRMPDYFAIFQGMSLVFIISFSLMIPLAVLTCYIWPAVQNGIKNMQQFYVDADVFGMWLFGFTERILVPTGLHRFVYYPFFFGPAVVDNGLYAWWIENVPTFAASTEPLVKQAPQAGYALYGNISTFCSAGAGFAMIAAAKKENRTKVSALIYPAVATAFLLGITEPVEFTYLFLAPWLFVINAAIGATLCVALYLCGVVGFMGGGFNDVIFFNWIFYWANHKHLIFIHIALGTAFALLNFFVFKYLIIKFDVKTPGRSNDETDMKLFSKKDVKEKQAGSVNNGDRLQSDIDKATICLAGVGGAANIEMVSNCQTRLRLVVKDASLVAPDSLFKEAGAFGLVKKDNNLQIIIGMSCPQLRAIFEDLMKQELKQK